MKKAILLFFLPTILFAQKPKLVVGIVIDQMRYEMLERYSSTFGENGFKKLQAEGFSFNNCNYNYIPTYTGPGHATIFSGQNPKKHGIISNDWYVPQTGKMVYCVEDNKVKTVGSKDKNGNRSPRNYKSPSLADLVKQSDKSKSFGVSIKDRGAILPAGKNASGAFWLDSENNFVTSTYYSKALPIWLSTFNKSKYASQYLAATWDLSLPAEKYTASDVDFRKCESTSLKKEPIFPYNLEEISEKKGAETIRYTPFGNTLLTDVAIELMKNEALGKDEHTDFFSISYSATDYAGHAFGPRSVEVQDMYIKLDLEIERLINYLDSEVGKGQYTLFLTSDHGAVDCPGTKTNPAEYVIRGDLKSAIDSISLAEFGSKIVSKVSNFQIWLDHDLIEKLFLNLDDVAFIMVEKLKEYKGGRVITRGWTQNDLLECDQPTCEQFKRTYKENLSGDVFFMTAESYLINSNQVGTSHGTGYSYDTHVPLLIYGWNVTPGSSNENIIVQDIAPTLHGLLKLNTNTSFDGENRRNLMN